MFSSSRGRFTRQIFLQLYGGRLSSSIEPTGPAACHNRYRQQCSSSSVIFTKKSKDYCSTSVSVTSSRCFSSKTPVSKSNLATARKPTSDAFPYEINTLEQLKLVSNNTPNVKEAPQLPAVTQKRRRKRKEILKMDEAELEGYAIMRERPPLPDRLGDSSDHHFLKAWAPEKRNYADWFSIMHRDWDLRSENIKRWYKSLEAEQHIKQQAYNPKRHSVLGNDLAVAHFIVFRKGRIRFRDQPEWVTEYRKDAKPGVPEENLPVMRFDLCTMPVEYDPRYRLEAIDCSQVPVRYEGLKNFENLGHVKWLSFKDSPFIDDWCLDRIARIFHETLEYIDLSGCQRLSDRGIGTLARCKRLKTLVVEDMSHVKHLEIVAALLEDHNAELTVIGVNYEKRMEELRIEGELIEQKLLEEAKKEEANTITIEPNQMEKKSDKS